MISILLLPVTVINVQSFQGIVKVGAANMDEHKSVGQPYNVRGFPTIKVFGLNKNTPEDYNGEHVCCLFHKSNDEVR